MPERKTTIPTTTAATTATTTATTAKITQTRVKVGRNRISIFTSNASLSWIQRRSLNLSEVGLGFHLEKHKPQQTLLASTSTMVTTVTTLTNLQMNTCPILWLRFMKVSRFTTKIDSVCLLFCWQCLSTTYYPIPLKQKHYLLKVQIGDKLWTLSTRPTPEANRLDKI